MHRDVGVLQHVFRVTGSLRAQHDPYAGGDVHKPLSDRKGFGERIHHALCGPMSVGGLAHAMQHEHELVAVETSGHGLVRSSRADTVGLANTAVEPLADKSKQFVSHLRAKRDIDPVEPVAVDEHHGEQVGGVIPGML